MIETKCFLLLKSMLIPGLLKTLHNIAVSFVSFQKTCMQKSVCNRVRIKAAS